ncbi:MAG: hypothetical protein IPH78_09565 [Bacteroidetes bacterium]|jgi:hypothetical protein|nr:hypothetical protein [Bacteroidota bacterium]MBK8659351.1 hypothetical protein [Bacteroidota bacterium]
MRVVSIIFIVTVILSGCKKAELTPEQYKQWLAKEEALNKTVNMGDYRYTVRLLPNDWVAYTLCQNCNADKLTAKLNEVGDLRYFAVTIDNIAGSDNLLKKNIGKESEYFERLYYVSYMMKEDLELISNGKHHKPVLYSYERVYDLSSRVSFMTAFASDSVEEDFTLKISPKFFSRDPVTFRFKQKALHNLPKLLL